MSTLKALVWVKSAGITALLVGLIWAALRADAVQMAALLLCGVLWGWGIVRLSRKARSVASRPATGLPGWVLTLVGFGQFISAVVCGLGEAPLLTICVNVLAVVTIFTRTLLCQDMGLRYNERTADRLMMILLVSTALHGCFL